MSRNHTDYEWYETPPRDRWIWSELYVRTKLSFVKSDKEISALIRNLMDWTDLNVDYEHDFIWGKWVHIIFCLVKTNSRIGRNAAPISLSV